MDTDKDDTSGRERDPAGGRRGCVRVHVTVVSADRTGVVSPLSCHLGVASHASVPTKDGNGPDTRYPMGI